MTAKTIIASVFITIIIISPVVYFVLPLLYPGMKEGGSEEGVLLQSVIGTFSSQAVLFDENLTSTLIPDTELTITTQGNSYLAITFNSFAMILLDILFTGEVEFYINLVITGVGNRSTIVYIYDPSPGIGDFRFYSQDVVILFSTETLAAGTYEVGVYWYSGNDEVGDNGLWFNVDAYLDYPRTLWVQELAS